MITPRRTRLVRVPSLRAMQRVLTDLVADLDPVAAADTFVLVPTRAAGEQLRRTVEDRLLPGRPVFYWPRVGPREDFYRDLASRVPGLPAVLSPFDREALAGRLAREVMAEGVEPPFAVRPALVAEMLALYDHVRRQGRTVEDFDRNLRGELEPAADTDRGAAQLLRQTAFLTRLFAAYEQHLAATGAIDEHGLRALLLERPAPRPLAHVVVTVADRVADPDGLWPVDFTLLSALPALARVDVVATEGLLAAGLLERIHAALPDLEEVKAAPADEASLPCLATPAPDAAVFTVRDREEELAGVARRIKAARRSGDRTPLCRHALVVRRPLPYLYLARSVFDGAGVAFEALDTLPLAAEPYAAALDVVLDAVESGFARAALVALLRSPHLAAHGSDGEPPPRSIAALDRALAEARYLGGLDRLAALAAAWDETPDTDASRSARERRAARPALATAVALAQELAPLGDRRPMLAQLELLQAFLERHHRESARDAPAERLARVRRAVLGALASLARAYATHDPGAEGGAAEVSSAIRRWLGAQTFALGTGEPGVRVLDAQAARFADVDDVQLLGLIEGEWPEPVRRSIFYPPFLLGLLDPAPAAAADPDRRDSEVMAAARAAFADLVLLARQRVRASSFRLEADAVVEPSPLVDDLAALGLVRVVEPPDLDTAVFVDEALLAGPPMAEAVPPGVRAWARLRADRPGPSDPRYRGEAGPWTFSRVSVSRIERYLKCPFQFFASEVLGLEEEPEDADRPPPWERGRFLHAIFETFFREWQQAGHRRMTPALVPEARRLLTAVCERALAMLAPHEAALERPRLFGSAVSPGIVDRVLSMEAERTGEVEERLVEYRLDADFAFRTGGGEVRTVPLRAQVDRVDLLGGGAFRVIDYKSKTVPDLKRSVQLQIYTSAVAQQLARDGDPRVPVEALYLSLEGETAVRALRPVKGQSLDDLVRAAEDRLVRAIDDIGAGHFPARPAPRSLCTQCPFDAVCRKPFAEAVDG